MSDPNLNEQRRQGLEALDRGDFPGAIQGLSQAAADPRDIEARCKLAWAQSRCGMHAEALVTLDSALRQAPGDAELHFYHGAVLIDAGRLPEAAVALQEVLRLHPGHSAAAGWLQWLHQSSAPAGGSLCRRASRSR